MLTVLSPESPFIHVKVTVWSLQNGTAPGRSFRTVRRALPVFTAHTCAPGAAPAAARARLGGSTAGQALSQALGEMLRPRAEAARPGQQRELGGSGRPSPAQETAPVASAAGTGRGTGPALPASPGSLFPPVTPVSVTRRGGNALPSHLLVLSATRTHQRPWSASEPMAEAAPSTRGLGSSIWNCMAALAKGGGP